MIHVTYRDALEIGIAVVEVNCMEERSIQQRDNAAASSLHRAWRCSWLSPSPPCRATRDAALFLAAAVSTTPAARFQRAPGSTMCGRSRQASGLRRAAGVMGRSCVARAWRGGTRRRCASCEKKERGRDLGALLSTRCVDGARPNTHQSGIGTADSADSSTGGVGGGRAAGHGDVAVAGGAQGGTAAMRQWRHGSRQY